MCGFGQVCYKLLSLNSGNDDLNLHVVIIGTASEWLDYVNKGFVYRNQITRASAGHILLDSQRTLIAKTILYEE